MKYIIIDDLEKNIKKNKYIYLLSIIIFVIYAFYIKHSFDKQKTILDFLGIILDTKFIALISFYIFNFVLPLYISLVIYINGLRVGYDYLFTRMKLKTWNISKIISIMINVFLIKFVMVIIFFVINNFLISHEQLIYILANYVLLINIILLIIGSYIFGRRSFIVVTLFCSIMYLLIGTNTSVYLNNYFILTNILLLIFSVMVFMKVKLNKLEVNLGG